MRLRGPANPFRWRNLSNTTMLIENVAGLVKHFHSCDFARKLFTMVELWQPNVFLDLHEKSIKASYRLLKMLEGWGEHSKLH